MLIRLLLGNQIRMWMNQNNQCILDDQDVVTAWLREKEVKRAVFEDVEPINIYNDWCFAQDIDATIQTMEEYTGDDYVEHCVSNWNLPDEYRTFSVHQYCLDKCDTSEKQQRIALELGEFEKRGMIPVLVFLKYLVDTCKENNIVLGVGRGSSVASYCLYLLGVHKIDSLKYKLDIKEFLK